LQSRGRATDDQERSGRDASRKSRTWWQKQVALVVNKPRLGTGPTLAIAMMAGVLMTIVVGYIGGFGFGWLGAPVAGLIMALFVALLISPESFLIGGWRKKTHPDHVVGVALLRAIRTLMLYTLLGMLAGGFVAGILVVVFAGPVLPPLETVRWALQVGAIAAGFFALAIGVGFGLSHALKYGGEFVLLHWVIRSELTKWDVTPKPFIQFLEGACGEKLLRRAGAGFTFNLYSESLRDSFARLYREIYPDTKAAKNAPPPPRTLGHKHKLDSIRHDDPRWQDPLWRDRRRHDKANKCRCPHCCRHRRWWTRTLSEWAKDRRTKLPAA
jgi:hypothetical protein